jgi:putative transposase
VPRDRNGTFTPRMEPKGARRLGGLDEMIISLYAGGMTLRDIQHHLASTIGTELSYETISKITDQVAEEVLAWQRRPLEAWRIPLVVSNPGVKGFGCTGTHITRCRRRSSAATSS